ncbi:alpha/beta hydrolase family protein [Flavisericum labens]|uniref:alpha/beta hydrolase family protein n=1 Tax=Flavisericum labens TaxID=3377112 RepID=UPI00387B735B
MKLFRSVTLAFLLLSLKVIAQEPGNALSWRMSTAYNNFLLRDMQQQYDLRDNEFSEALKSKENLVKYRDECIERYKNIVGDFPEKSKLNAKVVGTTQMDGFRIENIIFESSPKRYVTANLYIPDGNGPFPATLHLCGHGLRGKAPLSRAATLMVTKKIAVLVVDPIGQGERIQFIDENSKSLTRGATTEHTLVNAGANLLGSSLAAYEYWDNHRAIDYLENRKDIDNNRIGVYGSSGGGTQTTYMLGLDERIKVATVCSYFTKRQKVLEVYGASDGCQHIPYEGREQLELADFVLMMAPKPVLIMSGKYDFVDYWGATQAFKDLEQAYTVLGQPEHVKMVSVEAGHGMPKPKREAMTTWFKTWFYGDDTPVKETETRSTDIENLNCTETGQVITSIAGNISIPEFHRQEFQKLKSSRKDFLKKDSIEIRTQVMKLLGIEVLPTEEIDVLPTGSKSFRKFNLHKYQINRTGQFPVPCLVLMPENANAKSDIFLYLNESGKADVLNNEPLIDHHINQNDILVVPDLRGFGETADPINLNDSKYWNWEYRNAMASMHIGKPIMGQRVVDVMTVLDFIEQHDKLKNHDIKLIANGLYGPTAIHTTYLDSRINRTEISRSIKSFYNFLENPMQKDVYTNVLYGVLKFYDLQDLMGLSGKDRIRFVD